jgi:hypothetical protein
MAGWRFFHDPTIPNRERGAAEARAARRGRDRKKRPAAAAVR